MSAIFSALVAGWCFRSAVECAIDGKAWLALGLGLAAAINLAIAVTIKVMNR